jgi:hypothetical protein
VSIDTAVRVLNKEFESHFETVEQTLRRMEPLYKEPQQSVWALTNYEQVTERVIELVNDATDGIVLIVLDEALLDEEVITSLEAASGRGVSVYVGTDEAAVREIVEAAEFDAEIFTTDLIEWFDAMTESPRIGRLLMTDRGPVLVSALHEAELPGVPNETAAWTDGIDHGMATFAERVLTYELLENVEGASEPSDSE